MTAIGGVGLMTALAISACQRPSTEWKDGAEILPNGLKTIRSTLPSGKHVLRMFAADNSLLEESHTCGDAGGKTAILLSMSFDHGRKTGEVYIHDGRVVSREVYERERVKY